MTIGLPEAQGISSPASGGIDVGASKTSTRRKRSCETLAEEQGSGWLPTSLRVAFPGARLTGWTDNFLSLLLPQPGFSRDQEINDVVLGDRARAKQNLPACQLSFVAAKIPAHAEDGLLAN